MTPTSRGAWRAFTLALALLSSTGLAAAWVVVPDGGKAGSGPQVTARADLAPPGSTGTPTVTAASAGGSGAAAAAAPAGSGGSGSAYYNPSYGPGVSSTRAESSYKGGYTSFPQPKDWITFDMMWELNSKACAIAGGINADGKLTPVLKSAILQVAEADQMDPRLIWAQIMVESSCTLDTPGYPHGNNGIMQITDGAWLNSSVSDPDPIILQMIQQGVGGIKADTSAGIIGDIGFKARINMYPSPYIGLWAYNKGDTCAKQYIKQYGDNFDLSQTCQYQGTTLGTSYYCSDIANYLTGGKNIAY